MGWTSYHATHYKKGKIDRKAECDAMWNDDPNFEVLKSSMVGSIYYAAIKRDATVFGVVFITSTNAKEYCNFAYKDMDETMGPGYYDCPKGILDLLTPTASDWANEWRQKCYEKHEQKKNPDALSNLPLGTVIKFTTFDGQEHKAFKHPPGFQFKRPFWMDYSCNGYVKQKYIPDDYVIVKRGE